MHTRRTRDVLTMSSVISLSLMFVVGVVYIPTEHLIDVKNVDKTIVVLNSVFVRLSVAPVFTLAAWLGPLLIGTKLPLRYLSPLFSLVSIVVGCILLLSLCAHRHRVLFVHMLRTMPHSGYMWHDSMLIALSSFLIQPASFWLIMLGPGAVTCAGRTATNRPPLIFIFVACVSLFIVVPTAYQFVDETNGMFIATFPSENITGKLLSYSMVIAFTKTYHLICRSVHHGFLQYKSFRTRIILILWLLLGTALVQLWGSAAWTLHLAFVSFMNIRSEGIV